MQEQNKKTEKREQAIKSARYCACNRAIENKQKKPPKPVVIYFKAKKEAYETRLLQRPYNVHTTTCAILVERRRRRL